MTFIKQITEWYRHLCPVLILSMSLQACTYANIDGTAEEYGSEGKLKIEFDWSESRLDSAERPDSLTLVFDCIADSSRMLVKGGPNGAPPTDVVLPNGEWICAVLNEKMQGASLAGLDEFCTRDSFNIKGITAIVDTLSYTEAVGIKGGIDTNPDIPYFKEIDGNVSGFGRVRVNGVKESNLVLSLQDLALLVRFNLNLRIEGGVTVERMIGEVSGVPGSISLMSKEVVANRTGRTLFDIYPVEDDTTRWSGTVKLAGIVPPESNDVILGNGILTIRTYVESEKKRMIFITAMNLKSLMDQKPMLVSTDRSGIYRCSEKDTYVFDIASTLWLTPAGVRPCDDGLGLNEWVNRAKIDGNL